MIRFLALLLACLSLPLPVAAQPAAEARVALDTGAGRVVILLHLDKAPITAGNFLRYVKEKRLDGTSFYRGYGSADYGFVQGGAQNDPKRVRSPIAHEPTSQTGLIHDDGALSMARNAPGSASGDFFIVLGNMPAMDANPQAQGDNAGFAVFGHVVEGLDIIKTIVIAPKSATLGEGVMKGQMLEQAVKILTARQLP